LHDDRIEIALVAPESSDFEAIRRIRREVFVQEQGVCPANEFDDTDRVAVHLLAWRGGEAVGTARLYSANGLGRIGRVAVLASQRGQGVGEALMARALEEAGRMRYSEIVLHAQTRVQAFYTRLGFEAEGAVYEEENIPHITMRARVFPSHMPPDDLEGD
jgi:predicted GNAT family N-acyltransferase